MKKILSFIAKLSKREKIFFYLTVSVLVISFISRVILIPIVSRIKSLDTEIEEKRKALRNSLQILARKDKIEEEGRKYRLYLEKIFPQKTTPEDETVLTFLKEVETMVKNSDINLLNIRPIGSEEAAPFRKETLSLECEAPLERILVLFSRIECSTQILRVEKFHLTPKGAKSPVARCSIEISMLVATAPVPVP
ncbi:MAG: hypothetical protein V2A65_04930 [Candidatus Omnitrophota bacterium]